jgi:hypothetical protein
VAAMDSSMSVDEDTLGGTEIALPPPIAAPAVGGSDGKAGGGRGSSIDTDLLEIPVEEFGEKAKIGRGSFGEVFRCQVRAPRRQMCLRGTPVHCWSTLARGPTTYLRVAGQCGSMAHLPAVF